jgi:hypothetical protein
MALMTILRPFLIALWLLINLIIEIFAAMLTYIYLDLYHREMFGNLVGIAREILISFTQHLTNIAPDFANQANTSLLGEFGPKAILLLVIGLLVSAVLRSLTMIIFKGMDNMRPSKNDDGAESGSIR